MSRSSLFVSVTAMLLLAGCGLSSTENSGDAPFSSAFSSIPVGYDIVQSSFASATDSTATGGPGAPWMPNRRGPGGRGPGGPGGPGMGGFMGGGFGPGFLGDIGVGHGFGHGPFGDPHVDSTCTFAASTGNVTCGPTTRGGLTTTTIATYKTLAGVAQAKPDSTTDYARVRVSVSGTRTLRDSATAVVSHSSDRTVTGLSASSTSRTVNGTSSGTESTTGTSDQGAFTSVRIAADTVKALVIPVQDGRPTYPSSGSVTRYMKVTATVAGASPVVSERRETITYNGTATAAIVITENGVTKNCTVALPHGRPTCQ